MRKRTAEGDEAGRRARYYKEEEGFSMAASLYLCGTCGMTVKKSKGNRIARLDSHWIEGKPVCFACAKKGFHLVPDSILSELAKRGIRIEDGRLQEEANPDGR